MDEIEEFQKYSQQSVVCNHHCHPACSWCFFCSLCSYGDEKAAAVVGEQNGGGGGDENVDVENNAMTQTESVEMKMINSNSENTMCCLASANDDYEVKIFKYDIFTFLEYPVSIQGGPSGQIVGWGWVGLDLSSSTFCLALLWLMVNCQILLGYMQDGGTSQIKVNPTQLSDQMEKLYWATRQDFAEEMERN